jgi:hypothetical protein
LALGNIKLANECILNHLDYYWAFPVTTYYELEGIVNQGVCELLIAAPLTFDLERVSKENLPIRVVANLAYDNYIPRANGIKGFYIRPEDIGTYEKYISTIEFAVDDLSKESTLLHVYKDNKEWPGNLNLLLTNLNFNIDNRSIPDDFAEVRMNCQQRCMRNKNCHFCDSAFLFGDQVRKEVNIRRKDH